MHRHRPTEQRGPEAAAIGSELAAKVAQIEQVLRWELVNHPPANELPEDD